MEELEGVVDLVGVVRWRLGEVVLAGPVSGAAVGNEVAGEHDAVGLGVDEGWVPLVVEARRRVESVIVAEENEGRVVGVGAAIEVGGDGCVLGRRRGVPVAVIVREVEAGGVEVGESRLRRECMPGGGRECGSESDGAGPFDCKRESDWLSA